MADDGNGKVAFGLRHLATVTLTDFLKDGPRGRIETDEKLREVCGYDCAPKGKGYGYLQSASRACVKFGFVWKRIRGARAIECLGVDKVQTSAKDGMRGIGRRAKREVGKLRTVPLEKVPEADRSEFLALAAQLGMAAMVLRSPTTKALTARNISEAIELPKLLEAMKK